ncbi:MAG: hypothetical protein U0931_39805 [Vulcanimicrobiota bacterium]
MRISHLPAQNGRRVPTPRLTNLAPTPPPPDPKDQAQIRAAEKKKWRSLEWASFGGQMVGGALVLGHQGGIGLAIFAASSAAMVYAGYKRQRA